MLGSGPLLKLAGFVQSSKPTMDVLGQEEERELGIRVVHGAKQTHAEFFLVEAQTLLLRLYADHGVVHAIGLSFPSVLLRRA